MALDEAILEAVSSEATPPTLRLFAWTPPCLSIGVAQKTAEVDRARLGGLGWDLVRRPTGGRALLHTDEITYSLAAPTGNPLVVGGVLPSYRRLGAGILRGLELLGLRARVQREEALSDRARANPVCFEVPSAYEITVDGKKLVGSAQVRRRGGVLQHGSLPLWGDIGRACLALRYPSEEARLLDMERLRQRATTVEACLGTRVTWQQAAEALSQGFSVALGIVLDRGEPTPEEQRRSAQLARDRYAAASWTDRL
jgi:lipoate-protein ligase A